METEEEAFAGDFIELRRLKPDKDGTIFYSWRIKIEGLDVKKLKKKNEEMLKEFGDSQ